MSKILFLVFDPFTQLVDSSQMPRPLDLRDSRLALRIRSALGFGPEIKFESLEFLDFVIQSIGNTL